MNWYRLPFCCPKGHKATITEVATNADGDVLLQGICIFCGDQNVQQAYSSACLIKYADRQDRLEEAEDPSLKLLLEFHPKGKPS